MKRLLSLTALVIIASGCTSDADKLAALQREAMTQDLVAQHYQEKFDSVFKYEKVIGGQGTFGPKTRAYADSAVQAKIKRDLAQRELNRFMR